MNLLRGILSIGIVIGCILNWFEIETEFGVYVLSGSTWIPVTILLYASILTTGYAFYNSYRNSNQNSWIYLTCGLYGVGLSIYIYLSVREKTDYINDTVVRDLFAISISNGLGIYLTPLFSFFLSLTGLDKSHNEVQVPQQTFDQPSSYMRQQDNNQSALEKTGKPNLQDWLKENPSKSTNDYFSNYGPN